MFHDSLNNRRSGPHRAQGLRLLPEIVLVTEQAPETRLQTLQEVDRFLQE